MAENKYITQTQENGQVLIAEEVLVNIISQAVAEVEGAELSGKPGINWGKGIKLSIDDDNSVTAKCYINVAYDQSIAPAHMRVQTDAGLVEGWHLSESQYRLKLNLPSVLDLTRRQDGAYVELGDPGIPHTLVELDELSYDRMSDLLPYALELRHDPIFPKGVNVSFYTRLDEGKVRVLTYERGVEDYTLACGTGCASIAAVMQAKGQLPGGVLTAQNRGGELTVTLEEADGALSAIYLEGPVQILSKHHI